MKRRKFPGACVALLAVLVAGVAACSNPQPRAAAGEAPADVWLRAPEVQAVVRRGGVLTVAGEAEPGDRVVLRQGEAGAYAAVADDAGRFEIALRAPTADALMGIESREGQEATQAPYRLFVAMNPAAPSALLSAGAPSRRLGAAVGTLDAVDSDGRAAIASGRAANGSRVSVSVNGGAPGVAYAAPDGRWTLPLPRAGGMTLSVGGRSYTYPGVTPTGARLALTAAGGGWSIDWTGADGVRQTTWFPNAG